MKYQPETYWDSKDNYRYNPDEQLRKLERRYRATGAEEDLQAWVNASERAGLLYTWGGELLGQWEETTAEDYDDSLNVLPPLDWRNGGFLVGEAYSSTHQGATVYHCYQEYANKYWMALVTRKSRDGYVQNLRNTFRARRY